MASIEIETLGVQIDNLYALREQKRELEARVKAINAAMAEREAILMVTLDASGNLRGARGDVAAVNIIESVVPQTEDWARFTDYVRRTNKFELLEKRVSAPAFRELAAQRRDKTVPGLVPFTKCNISLKKVY